jgi:predicted dehydrogenase
MCRKRGRIVLVGVVGLELSRADFYEKELSFQVSCSYGPGRYDEKYEQQGQDYPLGFVRWTEQRNFEAVLDLMATGAVNPRGLISHRFPLDHALEAYSTVSSGKALGIVLGYPAPKKSTVPASLALSSIVSLPSPPVPAVPQVVIGIIGAGGFTGQVLLPALRQTGARLKVIASAAGVTSTHLGKKFGFELSTTDADRIFSDPEINAVMIATRHASHARFVMKGLVAGKAVYVEKPLCVNEQELHDIMECHQQALSKGATFLMVGFNRRFAPHVLEMKRLLGAMGGPKTFIMTVNAGTVPASHWVNNAAEGGRIVGEACHFIDLIRYLAGVSIIGIKSTHAGNSSGVGAEVDTATITLELSDGSTGTVHYFSNGHKSLPKERLEVFCGGRVLQLNNFVQLTGFGWPGFSKHKLWKQDKGHAGEMVAFVSALRKGESAPIPFSEIYEVTKASFWAAKGGTS